MWIANASARPARTDQEARYQPGAVQRERGSWTGAWAWTGAVAVAIGQSYFPAWSKYFTSASTFCGPRLVLKFGGITSFGKPGVITAFGSSIDCLMKAAPLAAMPSSLGPTAPVVPASESVWQAP